MAPLQRAHVPIRVDNVDVADLQTHHLQHAKPDPSVTESSLPDLQKDPVLKPSRLEHAQPLPSIQLLGRHAGSWNSSNGTDVSNEFHAAEKVEYIVTLEKITHDSDDHITSVTSSTLSREEDLDLEAATHDNDIEESYEPIIRNHESLESSYTSEERKSTHERRFIWDKWHYQDLRRPPIPIEQNATEIAKQLNYLKKHRPGVSEDDLKSYRKGAPQFPKRGLENITVTATNRTEIYRPPPWYFRFLLRPPKLSNTTEGHRKVARALKVEDLDDKLRALRPVPETQPGASTHQTGNLQKRMAHYRHKFPYLLPGTDKPYNINWNKGDKRDHSHRFSINVNTESESEMYSPPPDIYYQRKARQVLMPDPKNPHKFLGPPDCSGTISEWTTEKRHSCGIPHTACDKPAGEYNIWEKTLCQVNAQGGTEHSTAGPHGAAFFRLPETWYESEHATTASIVSISPVVEPTRVPQKRQFHIGALEGVGRPLHNPHIGLTKPTDPASWRMVAVTTMPGVVVFRPSPHPTGFVTSHTSVVECSRRTHTPYHTRGWLQHHTRPHECRTWKDALWTASPVAARDIPSPVAARDIPEAGLYGSHEGALIEPEEVEGEEQASNSTSASLHQNEDVEFHHPKHRISSGPGVHQQGWHPGSLTPRNSHGKFEGEKHASNSTRASLHKYKDAEFHHNKHHMSSGPHLHQEGWHPGSQTIRSHHLNGSDHDPVPPPAAAIRTLERRKIHKPHKSHALPKETSPAWATQTDPSAPIFDYLKEPIIGIRVTGPQSPPGMKESLPEEAWVYYNDSKNDIHEVQSELVLERKLTEATSRDNGEGSGSRHTHSWTRHSSRSLDPSELEISSHDQLVYVKGSSSSSSWYSSCLSSVGKVHNTPILPIMFIILLVVGAVLRLCWKFKRASSSSRRSRKSSSSECLLPISPDPEKRPSSLHDN